MKHKILKTFILTFILLLPTVIFVGCGTTNKSNQDNELKQDNVFYFDDANININNINFSFLVQKPKFKHTQLSVTITATNGWSNAQCFFS